MDRPVIDAAVLQTREQSVRVSLLAHATAQGSRRLAISRKRVDGRRWAAGKRCEGSSRL